jgi:hypothetical protein
MAAFWKGHAHGDGGSLPGIGDQLTRSPQSGGAFPETGQANPALRCFGRSRGCGVKSAPIILDLEHNGLTLDGDSQSDQFGAGVFLHIVEGLLNYAEKAKINLWREEPVKSSELAFYHQPGAGLKFLAQVAAGGAQTKLVEVVGAEVARNAAGFFQRLHEQLVTA